MQIPLANNQRNRNDQVVKMDVDAVQFNKLTDEERELCIKERRCFKCRKQGHSSRYCHSGQPSQRNQDDQGRGWSGVTSQNKDQGRGPNPQARTANIEEIKSKKTNLTTKEWMKYLLNAPDKIKEKFLDNCFAQDFLEAQN